jgi:hypothetical protein
MMRLLRFYDNRLLYRCCIMEMEPGNQLNIASANQPINNPCHPFRLAFHPEHLQRPI